MKKSFLYCYSKVLLILFFLLYSWNGHAQVLVQDFNDLQNINQFQGNPPSVGQVDKINLDPATNGAAIFSLGSEGADQFLQIHKATNQLRHFDRKSGMDDEPFLKVSFDFSVSSTDRSGMFAKIFIGDNLNPNSFYPDIDERLVQIGIFIYDDGTYALTHEILLGNGTVWEVYRTIPFSEKKRISIVASNSDEEIVLPYTGPDDNLHLIAKGFVHLWVGEELFVAPALNGESSSISEVKFLLWNSPQTASARLDNLSITTDIEVDPLPVDLLHFSAQAEGADVTLEWATASEMNSSHFNIERSLDGTDFTTIGEVQAAGNSKGIIDYSFVDRKAADRMSGILYYRLHQVDIDGSAEYSPLVQLSLSGENPAIRNVFPNPFDDLLEVSLLTQKDIMLQVRVLDLQGKLVLEDQQFFPASGQEQQYSLPASGNLAAGSYVLELTNGNGVQRYRVVKL